MRKEAQERERARETETDRVAAARNENIKNLQRNVPTAFCVGVCVWVGVFVGVCVAFCFI